MWLVIEPCSEPCMNYTLRGNLQGINNIRTSREVSNEWQHGRNECMYYSNKVREGGMQHMLLSVPYHTVNSSNGLVKLPSIKGV